MLQLSWDIFPLLLSPTIVHHLMSSLLEQKHICLKITCLGLPAPSVSLHSCHRDLDVVPRLYRAVAHTHSEALIPRCSFCVHFPLPPLSGEHLLIFHDWSQSSALLCRLIWLLHGRTSHTSLWTPNVLWTDFSYSPGDSFHSPESFSSLMTISDSFLYP